MTAYFVDEERHATCISWLELQWSESDSAVNTGKCYPAPIKLNPLYHVVSKPAVTCTLSAKPSNLSLLFCTSKNTYLLDVKNVLYCWVTLVICNSYIYFTCRVCKICHSRPPTPCHGLSTTWPKKAPFSSGCTARSLRCVPLGGRRPWTTSAPCRTLRLLSRRRYGKWQFRQLRSQLRHATDGATDFNLRKENDVEQRLI